MKPLVTWVVLANATSAHVVASHGIGKGLQSIADMKMTAEPPVEYADRAGIGHSIGGPGVAAVDQGDPKAQAETAFARLICGKLEPALQKKSFDRLVLVAGPHMLGELRKRLGKTLQSVVLAEIPKDLTALPISDLPDHLSDVLAV